MSAIEEIVITPKRYEYIITRYTFGEDFTVNNVAYRYHMVGREGNGIIALELTQRGGRHVKKVRLVSRGA